MAMHSYAEILEDTSEENRSREYEALAESVRRLELAERNGSGSREGIEALVYLNRLWSILIEDLGSSENGLPKELRAALISVGLWVLKEADRIRTGVTESFAGLIEVSSMIRDGLR
jgi:flagellar protein FlaF